MEAKASLPVLILVKQPVQRTCTIIVDLPYGSTSRYLLSSRQRRARCMAGRMAAMMMAACDISCASRALLAASYYLYYEYRTVLWLATILAS